AAPPPPPDMAGVGTVPPSADMGAPPQGGMPMGGGMPQGYGMPMGMPMMQPQANMNVQPATFQPFGGDMNAMVGGANIQLIHDVPLDVTVELGRTIKPISDILDFAPGTIIELDKIAGEPVDVLVNGKYVAKGEVVVIEESFGVRVTEIIK
ncbi:MAG: flagellar motor switch protein FliN, partial [Butyrivibrio sp.]|nr:flagellar motor switch protein FliN [Butyrivibrio sp.]